MDDKIIKEYLEDKDIDKYGTDRIIKLIERRKLPFPYIKYRLSETEVDKMFHNLKGYEPKLLTGRQYEVINLKSTPFFKNEDIMKYKGEYTLLVKDKEDYFKYNRLSDYFNEECRMDCRRYDQKISPKTYFSNYPKRVVYGAYSKYGRINLHTLRETVYRQTQECTSFRPTLMVSAVKLFNSTHILDFSSGWGDRLIGALAANVKYYCGVDPNPCLHPNYKNIVKKFGKNRKTETKLIESAFEKLDKIPDKPYDLIFTSPPYFILEQYTDYKDQSTKNYRNLDDWFNKFLKKSLDICWDKLVVGGYMIIIINNIRNYPDYVGKMIRERTRDYADDNLTVSTYMGLISYSEQNKDYFRSPQPMWIWKKESIEEKLNPPFVIQKVRLDSKRTVNIIRDDVLTGGTIIRGLARLLKGTGADIFVYADSHMSHVIPALSYIAKVLQKKAMIYVKDHRKEEWYQKEKGFIDEGLSYGHTEIIYTNISMPEREIYAKKEAERMKTEGKNAYFIPMSYDFDNYIYSLSKQIKKAWISETPKTMWIPTGSGTVNAAFSRTFPNLRVNLLQFGQKIPDKFIIKDKYKIYVPPEQFYEPAKDLPPYPSLTRFDAKVWQFVKEFARDGDYVLNRYRDPDTVVYQNHK